MKFKVSQNMRENFVFVCFIWMILIAIGYMISADIGTLIARPFAIMMFIIVALSTFKRVENKDNRQTNDRKCKIVDKDSEWFGN